MNLPGNFRLRNKHNIVISANKKLHSQPDKDYKYSKGSFTCDFSFCRNDKEESINKKTDNHLSVFLCFKRNYPFSHAVFSFSFEASVALKVSVSSYGNFTVPFIVSSLPPRFTFKVIGSFSFQFSLSPINS